jgi:alpha-tubulin suppressor-like RCC1 family protein
MTKYLFSHEGELYDVFVDYDTLNNYVGNEYWAWGGNSYGELGLATASSTDISRPTKGIAAPLNWKSVYNNQWNTGGIKTDGTLWVWGVNDYGHLGLGTAINYSSPMQLGTGTDWKSLDLGQRCAVAIKTNGTMWNWGRNYGGNLIGVAVGATVSSPVQVGTDTTWKYAAIGGKTALSNLFTVGLKNDGTLWGWGNNSIGQLGIDSNVNTSSPVQVAGGGVWKTVAAGATHVVAIKNDNSLWAWGQGSSGRLGNGTVTVRSSPHQIGTSTDWKAVAAGWNTSAAIKTDGTLWLWGDGNYGMLASNGTTDISSPQTTVAGGTNWKQISMWKHALAIKTDGTLWSWGEGLNAKLGDETTANKSSPVQTALRGTSWKQVSAGIDHSIAVTFKEE